MYFLVKGGLQSLNIKPLFVITKLARLLKHHIYFLVRYNTTLETSENQRSTHTRISSLLTKLYKS